jgi:type I restriction enzyme, S subunit
VTVQMVALSEIIGKLEAGVSVTAEGRPARINEQGVLKVSAVTGGIFRPEENKVVSSPGELDRLAVSPTRATSS